MIRFLLTDQSTKDHLIKYIKSERRNKNSNHTHETDNTPTPTTTRLQTCISIQARVLVERPKYLEKSIKHAVFVS